MSAVLALSWFSSACFVDTPSPGATTDSGTDTTAGPATTLAMDDESSTGSDATGRITSGSEGPGSDTVATTSGVDSSTGTAPLCAGNQVCLPPAPGMWVGPAVILAAPGAAAPPSCPPNTQSMRSGGQPPLNAPPATCACNPGAPDCPVALSAVVSQDADCGSPDDSTLLGVGLNNCGQVDLSSNFAGLEGPLKSCDAVVSRGTPEPAQWATQYEVCAPTDPEACDDGVCGPPSQGAARVCVLRDGMHDCPAGPYAEGLAAFATVNDTRGCSECVVAPDCGQVDFYNDPACGGASVATFEVGVATSQCDPIAIMDDVPLESAQWSGNPACTIVQNTESVGMVSPAEPFTMCCLPA